MGRTIKELRETGHYTQAELAQELGVVLGTIQNWEHGRSWPRRRYLRQLARMFGVKAGDIEAPK